MGGARPAWTKCREKPTHPSASMSRSVSSTRGRSAKKGTIRPPSFMTSPQPLSIENVPTPVASDGRVLVRIEACGLCHTDIRAAHGEWPI
jgi:hypothetical protein